MAVDRTTLRDVTVALHHAQMEYWRLRFGRRRNIELGPPASEIEMEQLEQLLRAPLPPSYRAFLELHNRWTNFIGDAHILSLADRQAGTISGSLEAFKNLGAEEGDEGIKHAFVIVGSDASQYLAYFDTRANHGGEMDVVEWTYERGEIARHPDFASYLQHQLGVAERLLAKEQNRPRPENT